jgi:hypothetical protein
MSVFTRRPPPRGALIYTFSLLWGGVIRHHPARVIERVIVESESNRSLIPVEGKEGSGNQIRCSVRATASASSWSCTPSLP